MFNRSSTTAVASAGDSEGIVTAEPDEDQAPEGDEIPDLHPPLTDEATSDEIAVAAAHEDQAADALRQRAARDQAAAQEIRDEAARLVAEAEARARPLDASATEDEKAAEARAERSERLRRAAAYAADAEAKNAAVKALEDERETLEGQRAEIDGQLEDLAGQKRDLAQELAAALEGGDLDLIGSVRARMGSITAREEYLARQLEPVAARLEAIGDGEMSPVWPQRELAAARHGARGRQVATALNWAQPERPEAETARRLEWARKVTEAGSIAAAGPLPPRTYVAGPQPAPRLFGRVND